MLNSLMKMFGFPVAETRMKFSPMGSIPTPQDLAAKNKAKLEDTLKRMGTRYACHSKSTFRVRMNKRPS